MKTRKKINDAASDGQARIHSVDTADIKQQARREQGRRSDAVDRPDAEQPSPSKKAGYHQGQRDRQGEGEFVHASALDEAEVGGGKQTCHGTQRWQRSRILVAGISHTPSMPTVPSLQANRANRNIFPAPPLRESPSFLP